MPPRAFQLNALLADEPQLAQGALVTVWDENGQNVPVATDSTGATPVPQPITVGAAGILAGWVPYRDEYELHVRQYGGRRIVRLDVPAQGTTESGNLPGGGADGKVLGRAGGAAAWVDPPTGLPASPVNGKVLGVSSGSPAWVDPPVALPTQGEADGKILARQGGTRQWVDPPAGLPSGGAAGQQLGRDAGGNAIWVTPQSYPTQELDRVLLVDGSWIVKENILGVGLDFPNERKLVSFYLRMGSAPAGSSATLKIRAGTDTLGTITLADGESTKLLTLSPAIILPARTPLYFDVTGVGSTANGASPLLEILSDSAADAYPLPAKYGANGASSWDPSFWSGAFGGTNSGSAAWSVPAEGVGRLTAPTAGTNQTRKRYLPASELTRDFDWTGLLNIANATTSAGQMWRLEARGDQVGYMRGWAVDIEYDSANTKWVVRLVRVIGTTGRLIKGAFDVPSSAPNKYRFRFQIVGDDVRLRWWADGQAEPGTWTLAATGGTAWVVDQGSFAVGEVNCAGTSKYIEFSEMRIRSLTLGQAPPSGAIQTPSIVGVATSSGSLTNWSVTPHPDTQPGDLLLLFLRGNSAITQWLVPSWFAEEGADNSNNGGTLFTTRHFWGIARDAPNTLASIPLQSVGANLGSSFLVTIRDAVRVASPVEGDSARTAAFGSGTIAFPASGISEQPALAFYEYGSDGSTTLTPNGAGSLTPLGTIGNTWLWWELLTALSSSGRSVNSNTSRNYGVKSLVVAGRKA